MRMESKNNFMLHKHVGLVHCASKLGLFQRKLLNCFIYFSRNNEQSPDGLYAISYRDLMLFLGLKNNDYSYIKDSIASMFKDLIEINLLGEVVEEPDRKVWELQAWFTKVRSDGAVIYYRFSDIIQSMVLDPSSYAQVNLEAQKRFTSKYALFLYENCARFKNIKKTPRFSYGFLRKLLGISDEQYTDWREFKRRVLVPAVTQVNEYSDIFIDYSLTRKGREVSALQFLISKNQKFCQENHQFSSENLKKEQVVFLKQSAADENCHNLCDLLVRNWNSLDENLQKIIDKQLFVAIDHNILHNQIMSMLRNGTNTSSGVFDAFVVYFSKIRSSAMQSKIELDLMHKGDTKKLLGA